jgi:putative flippase GtrA
MSGRGARISGAEPNARPSAASGEALRSRTATGSLQTACRPISWRPMKSVRLFFADGARYCLSGAGAALVDFCAYALLVGAASFSGPSANLVSRPVGGAASFLLHKYCTFENRGSCHVAVQFARFLCVWGGTFLISQFGVWLFVGPLRLPPLPAKILAEILAGTAGFLSMRFWIFFRRAD